MTGIRPKTIPDSKGSTTPVLLDLSWLLPGGLLPNRPQVSGRFEEDLAAAVYIGLRCFSVFSVRGNCPFSAVRAASRLDELSFIRPALHLRILKIL